MIRYRSNQQQETKSQNSIRTGSIKLRGLLRLDVHLHCIKIYLMHMSLANNYQPYLHLVELQKDLREWLSIICSIAFRVVSPKSLYAMGLKYWINSNPTIFR